MKWSEWVQTIHTQPGEISSLLDQHLGLSPMADTAQAKALIQAMQNRDDDIFFLEGEEDNEELIVYENDEEWHARRWSGEVNPEDMALFINYSKTLSEIVEERRNRTKIGEYYSLRPLIYGGDYWVDSVCADEVDRFQSLGDDRDLTVMLISWRPGHSLFELVESLRRGDRIGYFESLLGVLLPFTDQEEAVLIKERLAERFRPDNFKVLQWREDFDNYFELKNKVEEVI